MAIIQNERMHDVLYQSLWMSYSDIQDIADTDTIPDRGSVSYISGFMERFVRADKLFTPDGFDTLTQRFRASRERGQPFYNKEVADFALFSLGMVPEGLDGKGLTSFYADTGSASYSWLYTQSSFPTFQELAENFLLYCAVITKARDRYMRIEEDGRGGIRIVPAYENVRFRGVQEPDGNLRKLN